MHLSSVKTQCLKDSFCFNLFFLFFFAFIVYENFSFQAFLCKHGKETEGIAVTGNNFLLQHQPQLKKNYVFLP